jgi:hypothetical protein
MEGEDDKTLRSLPLALPSEQSQKAQNVNRWLAELRDREKCGGKYTALPTGLKPRLTASEDYNFDPPFRNNLFPHS